MSTLLRLLSIAFWMLPIQRFCTVLGLGVMAGFGAMLMTPMPLADTLTESGYLIALAPLLLFGGSFWRALAAPRVMGLVPWGRARLLFGLMGIIAAIPLSLVAFSWLYSLGMPRSGGLPSDAHARFLGLIIKFLWGWCAIIFTALLWFIASFIASRSPLAMLLLMLVCIGGAYGLWRLDIAQHPRLLSWRGPWSIVPPLGLCVLFGTWYLRTRRIGPPGWLLPGPQSVFATVALADNSGAGLARPAALQRLLLGGTSMSRILLQWLLVGGVLLGVLLVLGRMGEEEGWIAAHMTFAGLIFCPFVVAVQALAIVRRARALWLPSGFSREQLFAFVERTLLNFAIGMTLVFAAFLLLLWVTQPWHPALTLWEALLVILLPSLQLATHALTRPRGWDYYWRWPLVLLLCWFIAWKPLTSTDPVSWFGPRGWLWFVLVGVATLSFHKMARRRWLAEDLPRAATSP